MVSRRAVLSLLSVGSVTVIAGCPGGSDRSDGPHHTATHRPTSTRAEPVDRTESSLENGTATPECPTGERFEGKTSLSIDNQLPESIEGTISIARADGEPVLEERFELAADEHSLWSDVITRSGDYVIELALATGRSTSWRRSVPDGNDMPLGAYTLVVNVLEESMDLYVTHVDPPPTPEGC